MYYGRNKLIPSKPFGLISGVMVRKWIAKQFHEHEYYSEKSATLYIHWPFCAKLCPYCDFNKYVRDEIDHDLMEECLIREFQSLVRMYDVKKINSVYFGGGTPSLARPSTIYSILNAVSRECVIKNTAEITLEVNPTATEQKLLRDFKHAGINRVSIGVQALNNKDLKLLGREHSVGEAMSCLRHASHLFGSHVSIDLMFGRPGQTPTEWQKELQQVTDMKLNHVSLYELTMKKLTPMGKSFQAGKICLPSDEDMVRMYQDTKENLEAVGLHRYEISNFAKKGYESQHNLSYWCGKDYIGIGPGAHSRLSTFADNKYKHHALVQLPVPEHWINQIEKKGHGIRRCHVLTQQERIDEVMMLSLRMCTGIQSSAFQELVGWSYHLLKEGEFIQQSIRNDLLAIDTRKEKQPSPPRVCSTRVTNKYNFLVRQVKTLKFT
ncbi:radical S-adenosyl methionine domain-containing protein 1, mitochondrial-like isoform X2 [Hydractinia symbiolongicarpus]|uniref:radical S-adenosyl methionine domain-containing protein 1, mitochondrial-like isoform X2 n=1 Tax=Hydractinia symbiolongicarpus TaxID=13093 RepID=UPI00254F30FD|nr:radical S-adenosyl methionine domain-containing protein 1, mitochondrial-like isoform X2 [Hydractinia symbiolongicarpus]